MEDIAKYANRVLVMHRAKIAMYDTVEKVFAHAQQLLELGLSVPQVTQIFLKLRQMGLDIPRMSTRSPTPSRRSAGRWPPSRQGRYSKCSRILRSVSISGAFSAAPL